MSYLEQMLADGKDNLVYHIHQSDFEDMVTKREMFFIDYKAQLIYTFPYMAPTEIN